MRRLGTVIVAALVVAAAGCGGSSDSGNDKPTSTKPTASKPKSSLATETSFARCVKKAGVTLDPDGAVPGDRNRTQRPRGLKDPVPGAKYIGAASFAKGGFADVWIADSATRATDLSDGLSDPSLNPPDPKDWTFDHTRNILFAFHATAPSEVGDPSSEGFDRCLAHG